MRRALPLLLFLNSACDIGPAASPGLNYYLNADPVSLDPALSTDVQSGEMVTLVFDNLVQFDADARLHPGVAARWEVDTTGRVYTFRLRRGATFHDGRPSTRRPCGRPCCGPSTPAPEPAASGRSFLFEARERTPPARRTR